jgi:preprotein translocase subunit SecA
MTPTAEIRRTSFKEPERLLRGLDAEVHRWVGRYRRRPAILDPLRKAVDAAEGLAGGFEEMSDGRLQHELSELRTRFRRGGREKDGTLPAALAALREVARRCTGLHPFPVQLLGAAALHEGLLIEMATGEGKTITAGLAAVLAGWGGHPCHVITVNDYLVERDAAWMKPLYSFCGLRVGQVTGTMGPAERASGYGADITYVTGKEVLADFIRDRLQLGAAKNPVRRLLQSMLRPSASSGLQGTVQRGLHTAIVDEADSVLIDEAVTPLIISAPRRNEALNDASRRAHAVAQTLRRDVDYTVDLRYREITLTPQGLQKLEEGCATLPGLWRSNVRRSELVRQALLAREFFLRDRQYLVQDGRVVIIDESTGRPMPNRTWHQTLHQAIEIKEGLAPSDPPETVARLSFQRFFRCYRRLAGMTGTAAEAAQEFWHVYRMPVVTIPTHRPCVRVPHPDRFFATEADKWEAVVAEIHRRHATGQPILVGTRSVAASEHLARLLESRHLAFALLNATRLKEEAAIVALAGERGRITIATNMAGRGTDIRLGPGVVELGGLHVLATERHESGRVDRQLFGRAARQGDPGSCQAFVSLEDELFRKFIPHRALGAVQRWHGRSKGESGLVLRGVLRQAQRTAERQARRQREAVLRADLWLDEALSFAGTEGV